ncbi:MAG: hypothetical protein AAFX99_34990, partial [Myxococcota bacterium]
QDRHSGFPELLEALVKARTASPWRRALGIAGRAAATVLGATAVLVLTLVVCVVLLFTVDLPSSTPTEPAASAPPPGTETTATGAEVAKSTAVAKPQKVTVAERKAQAKRDMSQLNVRCTQAADAAQRTKACRPLVDKLHACCVDDWFEGVSDEPLFKVGIAGEAQQTLKTLCVDDAFRDACPLAAYAYAYSYHDYDTPEQNMVPEYMAIMQVGCQAGDYLSCVAMRNAYADGDYSQEGAYAIQPSTTLFLREAGAGCKAGNGHVCWLIAQRLMVGSTHVKANPKKAVPYMTQACQHGWPTGCLFAGLIRQNLKPEACAEHLRPYYTQLPENDIVGDSSTWSDVKGFCRTKRPIPPNDDQARQFWNQGCASSPDHRDRTFVNERKTAIRTACLLAKGQTP